MSDFEQEQLLIDLIQHYPLLYDKTSRDFKDQNKKNNAWDAIATAMDTTAEEIQRVWRNLRDRYARERRSGKNIASGSEAPDNIWPLFKYMTFLEKHIVSRKRVTNISRPSSASSCLSSLGSPTGSTFSIWDSSPTVNPDVDDDEVVIEVEDTILDTIQETPQEADILAENISPPAKKFKSSNYQQKDDAVPSTSGLGTKTNKTKADVMVEESLTAMASYFQEKKKPDKNMAFGQYVGLSLLDMSVEEQNDKKNKIIAIIHEPFP